MTKINRIVIHVCILFIRMRRFLFTLNAIDSNNKYLLSLLKFLHGKSFFFEASS